MENKQKYHYKNVNIIAADIVQRGFLCYNLYNYSIVSLKNIISRGFYDFKMV